MIIWATIINVLVVSLCVMIHYEFLFHLSRRVNTLKIRPRFKIVVGVFGALVAHSIEVWIFALCYHYKIKSGLFGFLQGNYNGEFLDAVYFSFSTFTTLGFGDIEPMGDIRFLTGIDILTGLVLITWSASYLFYEMQKHWKVK